MKICLPVYHDRGLKSQINEHFGRAPFHLVANLETGATEAIPKPEGPHCQCLPVEELISAGVECVICKSMGRGAATRLGGTGISLMHTDAVTVEEALAKYRSAELRPITPEALCTGHHH